MNLKYLIISFVLVVMIVAGYLVYDSFQTSNKYNLALQSELSPSDYHAPGTQIKEVAETYTYGQNWYHVKVMQFPDAKSASQGISQLIETYNPGKIILDKKYVNYVELSSRYNFYFYQSGKYILVLDMTGEKSEADSFVVWYYFKYSNQ
ncbi:MAG TPA: hypothetical protein VJI32_03100 [Candidatus Nanoarchaeia archaeon]|nr:hypothetical protein [Candidatus Nanoarchaeia archaeon]